MGFLITNINLSRCQFFHLRERDEEVGLEARSFDPLRLSLTTDAVVRGADVSFFELSAYNAENFELEGRGPITWCKAIAHEVIPNSVIRQRVAAATTTEASILVDAGAAVVPHAVIARDEATCIWLPRWNRAPRHAVVPVAALIVVQTFLVATVRIVASNTNNSSSG